MRVLSRNFKFINASRSILSANCPVLCRDVLMLSKYYSPDSSPVKKVVKKKRRISSSSEEDGAADKKVSESPKSKK